MWQAEKRDRDTDQAGRKAHRSISNTRKYRPAYTHAGVADWERGAGKQRKRVRQTAIDESNDEHEHCENEDEGDNAFSQM